MSFLNFEVDKKINIISAIALIVSLASIGWQIKGYLKGAQMQFVEPEQVTFFVQPEKNGGKHIEVVTDFTFLNTGDAGYSGIIKGEMVRLKVGGKDCELRWQNFGKWAGDSFHNDSEVPAHAFAVPGGQPVSYEVDFAPREIWSNQLTAGQDIWGNWIDEDVFIQDLNDMLKNKKKLEVECVAELYSGKEISAVVEINVDQGFIDAITKKGWSAPACRKSE